MKKIYSVLVVLLLFTSPHYLTAQEKEKKSDLKPGINQSSKIRPEKSVNDKIKQVETNETKKAQQEGVSNLKQNTGTSLEKEHIFSNSEMKELWERFSSDKEMAALLQDVRKKGFVKVQSDSAQWGFKADYVEDKSRTESLFCIYDFYNEKTKEKCTVFWSKRGDTFYKAYFVLDNSKKEFIDALENAQEWFVNKEGKIEKANSWHSCFTKNLKSRCSNQCAIGAVKCTPLLFTPFVGTSVYLNCVVGVCGGCAMLVSIGCIGK